MLPQPVETLLFALRKAATASSVNGATGKVVTVFSPKGGSGKTVIATNLAVAAHAIRNRSTLLIDLDLQFGDAALTLAIPPRATIADLAAASGDVDIDKLKAFVCTDARTSLALLAAPKRPEEAQMVGQAELPRFSTRLERPTVPSSSTPGRSSTGRCLQRSTAAISCCSSAIPR